MSYEGYRIKIGDTIIPNLLISAGTYKYVKEKRVIRSWTDARGIEHYDYFKDKKVTIKFSIRVRNLADHILIKDIFKVQDKLSVKYWDDYDCIYKTGTFQMSEPNISHMKAIDDEILYNATEIELREY